MDTENESPLSMMQQIERMRHECPTFSIVHSTSWIVLWRGTLTPLARKYDVQVLYSSVAIPLAGIERCTPHVEVVVPLLVRRSEPAGAIPHIFRNRVFPERPRLCLYMGEEWKPNQYIADTIILWALEWLVAYEGWRATGSWLAGGHHTERET